MSKTRIRISFGDSAARANAERIQRDIASVIEVGQDGDRRQRRARPFPVLPQIALPPLQTAAGDDRIQPEDVYAIDLELERDEAEREAATHRATLDRKDRKAKEDRSRGNANSIESRQATGEKRAAREQGAIYRIIAEAESKGRALRWRAAARIYLSKNKANQRKWSRLDPKDREDAINSALGALRQRLYRNLGPQKNR